MHVRCINKERSSGGIKSRARIACVRTNETGETRDAAGRERGEARRDEAERKGATEKERRNGGRGAG